MKKIIHIVVQHGLINTIYAENVDVDDVVIYDLDTDDNEEYDALLTAIVNLRKSNVKEVY